MKDSSQKKKSSVKVTGNEEVEKIEQTAKKQLQAKKKRRKQFSKLRFGLICHGIATGVFQGGIILGILGLWVLVASLLFSQYVRSAPDIEKVVEVLATLFPVAFMLCSGLMVAGSLIDVFCPFSLLLVPNSKIRFLAASILGLRLVTVLNFFLFLFVPGGRVAALISFVILQLICLYLWPKILAEVSMYYLSSTSLARDADKLFVNGIFSFIGIVVFFCLFTFFIGIIELAVLVPKPFALIGGLATAALAALIRIVLTVNDFTFGEAALAVIGAKYAIDYLHCIESLRSELR